MKIRLLKQGSARRASADIPSAGWRHRLNADYPPSTGADITLDGDLLAVIETLYKKVIARKALAWSFEDKVREIQHLIGQMTDEELLSYVAESLLLDTVKYENDKLESYLRKMEKPSSGHNHDDAMARCFGRAER